MRVVGWNFFEGGLGPTALNGRREPLTDRRQAAQALVQRLKPDVLVLSEALFGEGSGVQHEDYGRLFGFEHVFARSYDEQGMWGNAILSHRPFLDEQHRMIHPDGPQNRGMLAVQVEHHGQRLWVSTYHPHPWRRPAQRANDMRTFLQTLDGPAVFLADLNAVHPDDPFDEESLIRTHERFQTPHQARQSVARFHEAGRCLFDEVLPDLGWRSVPMPYHASMPTLLFRQPNDTGMRIDHALVSAEVTTATARIEVSIEADCASDHYPIVLDL